MCGRFTLTSPAEVVAEFFGLAGQLVLTPRFNIAPTQSVLVVRERGERSAREAVELQWGLVPSWAKDRSIGNKLINARAETVEEKPSFRSAFRRRRCLVVADGFYEWQAPAHKHGRKQPYWISSADGGPMAFAGLWEHWERDQDRALESCTIITTSANALMEPIHKRMPVIVEPADFATWLDPQAADARALDALGNILRPCDPHRLQTRLVTTHVNSPRNDDPSCIQAVE